MGAYICRHCNTDHSESTEPPVSDMLGHLADVDSRGGAEAEKPVAVVQAQQTSETTAGGTMASTSGALPTGENFETAADDGAAANGVSHVAGPDAQGWYDIVLDKATNPKLGVDVDAYEENTTLPIIAITGGLVGAWNQAYPQCEVREGDHIIEVNGGKGEVGALMDRCRQDDILRMKLRRGEFMPPI
eukprot:TRINITY_DN25712_c0_g1_i1.p1 TRINITY_DN25712_c0_g1~~TRINITY_DN25712_c0_g1_i1.p1  ORF type:complete len:188 (+),score=47.52 TRINITY_DN25712_c0_g1_i1:186-749(+)